VFNDFKVSKKIIVYGSQFYFRTKPYFLKSMIT